MGSTYKCTGCKSRFPKPPGFTAPAGNFHTYCCATEYGYRAAVKLRKKKEQQAKKEHTAAKKNLKRNDVRHQHKLTQKVFNRMRVLQELKWYSDRELPPRCISCQGLLGNDQWCCGHFKTTHNSVLRYDPHNTYLQHNQRCNMRLSGDIAGTHNTMGYKKGLIVRFGNSAAQIVIDYCDNTNTVRKWTCEELIANRKRYNKTIRELEQ